MKLELLGPDVTWMLDFPNQFPHGCCCYQCELYCTSSPLCDHLCGTGSSAEISCGNGGGAICAIDHLDNITRLCAIVNDLDDDALTAGVPEKGTSELVVDDATASGCDNRECGVIFCFRSRVISSVPLL